MNINFVILLRKKLWFQNCKFVSLQGVSRDAGTSVRHSIPFKTHEEWILWWTYKIQKQGEIWDIKLVRNVSDLFVKLTQRVKSRGGWCLHGSRLTAMVVSGAKMLALQIVLNRPHWEQLRQLLFAKYQVGYCWHQCLERRCELTFKFLTASSRAAPRRELQSWYSETQTRNKKQWCLFQRLLRVFLDRRSICVNRKVCFNLEEFTVQLRLTFFQPTNFIWSVPGDFTGSPHNPHNNALGPCCSKPGPPACQWCSRGRLGYCPVHGWPTTALCSIPIPSLPFHIPLMRYFRPTFPPVRALQNRVQAHPNSVVGRAAEMDDWFDTSLERRLSRSTWTHWLFLSLRACITQTEQFRYQPFQV